MSKMYKDEKNKARIDLVDPEFIRGIAEVLGYGAEKYEPYSFQKVTDGLDKYYAAAMRHMLDWRAGDFLDDESGKNHLLHVACNMMFLLRLQHRKTIGPLMPVEKLQKIWDRLNESKDNMVESGTVEECVDGRQADNNEGSEGRAAESENVEILVDSGSQKFIRARSCVVPFDGREPVVHGPDTDAQTDELHM